MIARNVSFGLGMDMSTRMTSLAINIALMGLILLQSIRSGLGHVAQSDAGTALAASIAAGNLHMNRGEGISGMIARQALAHGFGWVMLDALACAWTFSALSFIVLGRNGSVANPPAAHQPARPSTGNGRG